MSGETDVIETVYWEGEPERTRDVVWRCEVCYPNGDDGGHILIVCPQGVAHHVDDYARTRCGKDALGDDWWWRL
jgi:hypothetical protein